MNEPLDHVIAIPLGARLGTWWIAATVLSLAFVLLLTVAVAWLFAKGIGVWGVDYPVAWGFALINYVWWIGIASGGTFISAFFFLMQVQWRSALSRTAETMTVFAAACAGLFPILHLGRPWFFYWLLPYPDTMGLWPQFRSPLLWDFYAILTYVIGSVLFWYLGLVPDLASLRDASRTRLQKLAYGFAALGFRGSERQWRVFQSTYGVLAAVMAPLVVSVHSIVGLDFAGGETPGWHSTQFPPFFVFGAVLSGFATVLALIIPLRKLLHLEAFITDRHFDVLGRLMLTSSLCVAYSYAMEAFTVFYGGEAVEETQFLDKLTGLYAPVYWGTILFNVLLPQLLWWRRLRLNQPLVMAVSLLVIVGMWLERFDIVIASLHRTEMPSAWGDFHATFWDYATLFGTVGLFCLGFLFCLRFLPALSLFEMREEGS